ncbi:uncharacterized protein LOC127831827 [Dreissena polymorpha]|uniref:Uncharacterized protein n=1 Tax=Dreissena polymorpha TaxID=45954 RepID=A0A9D4JQU7_DREPO|nr:uncharacterized protein LOC127831827 [Dreissena polymorpha]KAH3816637.1 hypothetical protein DPMN_118155 [Dreissena polymorpha]
MGTAYVTIAICLLVAVYGEEIIASMDKTLPNNKCGSVLKLGLGQDIRFKSKGLAPDGYCGLTVFSPDAIDNHTCDALCVTFKTATISVCDVKLKFVGHRFASGDYIRELTCHDQNKNSFCWEVSSVRVEVSESYTYAYVQKRPLYDFDVDVSARCSRHKKQDHAAIYAQQQIELDRADKSYVHGIAVGVSLSCLFLIILFVAWCYTKHQAVSSSTSRSIAPPRKSNTTAESTSGVQKKGSIITTFRKKLNIKRKEPPVDEEEPVAIYRKTDTQSAQKAKSDDPEAPTEFSPLTTKNDTEGETFELEKETTGSMEPERDTDGSLADDSPKDGGAERASKLEPPEVIIIPGTPEPSVVDSD